MFTFPGVGPSASSPIKSIQSGTLTMSSATMPVTINKVDLTKSIALVSSAPSTANQAVKARLTDNVTLTLVANGTGGLADWQVVEFA